MNRVRVFLRFAWSEHRGRVGAVAALTAALSLTEGVGLLMLVPMLRLVGVPLGDGTTESLSRRVEAWLASAGIAPTLTGVLGVVVALVTMRAAVQWLLAAQEAALEAELVGRLRQRLFRAVVHLPWGRVVGERPAALHHAIGPQVDDVHSALLLLLQIVAASATIAAGLAAAIVVAPGLSLLVAAVGVLLFAAARWLRAPGSAEGDELLEASVRLFARIGELLGGLKMVHAHGAEARAEDTVRRASEQWAVLTLRTSSRRARVRFALTALTVVVLAALVWAGVRVASAPPAALMLMVLLYARLVPRVAEVPHDASALSQVLASFTSVTSLLSRCEATATSPDRHAATVAAPRGGAAPAIEVRDLTVRYLSAARDTIRGFSAAFPAGEFTAVVGPTGVGKTTLADTLLGLLDPQAGDVLVDGVRLASEWRAEWRARLGYLAQDPMLVHGTIRDNLRFARPEASDEALRAALRDAACDFVERLPNGLDAEIGDRGALLSGGERQRLALARALVRRPELLVLDEATSALDADTEARILETLRALRGRCTIVFCTHRDAVRRAADHVVMLRAD